MELVSTLRKELADWVHEYNTVGRLEEELTNWKKNK